MYTRNRGLKKNVRIRWNSNKWPANVYHTEINCKLKVFAYVYSQTTSKCSILDRLRIDLDIPLLDEGRSHIEKNSKRYTIRVMVELLLFREEFLKPVMEIQCFIVYKFYMLRNHSRLLKKVANVDLSNVVDVLHLTWKQIRSVCTQKID